MWTFVTVLCKGYNIIHELLVVLKVLSPNVVKLENDPSMHYYICKVVVKLAEACLTLIVTQIKIQDVITQLANIQN